MRNYTKSYKRKVSKIIYTLLIPGLIILGALFFSRENYSTGERVGYITKLSYSGLIFPGYEGELNMSQTGFNSSGAPFEFSIDISDKRNTNSKVVRKLQEALTRGLKVKLKYHQTFMRNWFSHRGSTNYFIDEVTFEK